MASLLIVAIGHAMTPPRALPCEKIHPFHLYRYFCVVTLVPVRMQFVLNSGMPTHFGAH